MSLKTTKDNVLNHIYDFFSGDRTCSNCKYLKEEVTESSKFFESVTEGREPLKMINKCDLNGLQIRENEVNTKNCRYFKRKYGSAPAKKKMLSFVRYLKTHSYKIIIVIVSLIGILVTYLLAKGFL